MKHTTKKRLEGARSLLPFYNHALELCANGGLKMWDILIMRNILLKCCINYDRLNWPALASAYENFALYPLCCALVREHGVDRGKDLFFTALRKIDNTGSAQEGLAFLVEKVVGFDEVDYERLLNPTRVKDFGERESRSMYVSDSEDTFRVELWTFDMAVAECVRDVYTSHQAKLRQLDPTVRIRYLKKRYL